MIAAFTRALVERRGAVALLLLGLTAAALVPASRVRVDGSIEGWFLEDDASLARYRRHRERFGTDEFVLVAALGAGAITPDGLRTVERIRVAAERLPGVARTRWVTTALAVEARGDDAIDVAPLARELPGDAAGVRELCTRAAACASTRGMLSLDPPATAVLVELRREAQDLDGKRALVAGLEALLAREAPPFEVAVTGPPAFDAAFLRHTERDLVRLGPISLLLVFGVVALAFRRASLALVPVAVVAASLVWTLAAMGLLGLGVNPISGNLVCVVLAIGVADSLHLLSEYRLQVARGRARAEAAIAAAPEVLYPCLFCSLTTVIGFASLATSEIRPIREFGLLAAASVVLAFLATFTLGPVLLSFVDPGPATLVPGPARRVARMGRRAQLAIVGGALLLLGLSVLGISRLEVGVNPVEYFRPDDPLRRATERVDAVLGGTANIELAVEAGPSGLEDPAKVAALAALEPALRAERGVSYSQSFLDPLRDLHRAWGAPGELPGSRELLAQDWLLLEADRDLDRLIRPDHAAGRISLRTQMSMTDRPLETIGRVERLAADPALAAAGVRVEVTGFVHLMASMYQHLLDSQVEGTLLALGLVAAAIAVFLRSLRLGLLALVPNLVPVIAGLGLMGALGIRLDVGTVMIESIALGLIVDDTVHTLSRLEQHLAAPGLSVPDALERTLSEVGSPVVTTSLALAAGFGTLALGAFLVNVYFGLISATVILFALGCDLVLTPALVLLFPGWLRYSPNSVSPNPAAAARSTTSAARWVCPAQPGQSTNHC